MRGNNDLCLYYGLLALFVLDSRAFPARAQLQPSQDIIVSANRVARAPELIGSSVTAFGEKDIARGQFVFISEALRFVPGAAIAQNGGPGGVASIRLRGASAGQTLVVIDGVRANDPAAPQGGYNAGNLSTAGISRVEILRGPQGLAWGADAIGGVVSIETADVDGRSTRIALEGGAYGTARGALAWSAGTRDGAYFGAEVSAQTTDGFSRAAVGVERDSYRSIEGAVRAGARLSTDLAGEIVARVQHAKADIDGFAPPTFAFGDTLERETTDDIIVTGRLSHGHPGKTRASGAATLSYRDISRTNDDAGTETFSADGRRLTGGYVLDVAIARPLSLTAGFEAEQQAVEVSGIDENAQRGGAFAIAEWRLAPSPESLLVLSGGARRDEFSNFDGATTARVSAAWSFNKTLILRGSWGEGYRAPTLFELNFSQFGVVPNPDLRPERARGYDFGAEWRSSADAPRLEARATYFETRTRDLIDFAFSQSGYFNISRSRARGVETDAAWRPADWIAVEATYTLLDSVDLDSGARSLRQPRHRGSVVVTVRPERRLSLAAALFANGREPDFPSDNAAYARLDLRAAFAASTGAEIFARLENVTDTDYQDVSGYGETGRAAYAGLRIGL